MTTSLDGLRAAFASPPVASRPWAFWFLNDDTGEEELLAQLDAFAEAGFGTVCPCARIGLSERIGYLTDAWWHLMRRVVGHCARLGLRVVLYDEASYPSGAANGLVVAEDPEFASRCLVPARVEVRLDAGEVRYVRPTLGRSLWDRRLATVVTTASGRRLVEPDAAGLVRLDAAELGPGEVLVEAFFDCPSGGTIRGAHAWQDDGSALAPASADLMNPDAVAAFLRVTHDAYAEQLGAWFGTTVVALFTDEPAPLGRGPRRDGIAWTPGLENDLAAAAGVPVAEVLAHLGEAFVAGTRWRSVHERVVAERVARVYHGAQRAWCDAHGLALTGHPERPDEVAALRSFTWPGQDTVWRWVLPGPSALTGPESAGPRTAASAAILRGGAPVVNEVCGAYGWRLSLDEVKWLLDWLAVRGTTDFLLHALFASVRGNRAFESEPDLGLHNAWWPHLPALLAYAARLSLLNAALVEGPRVAVEVPGDRVPADEVAPLYTHQVGFVYATPADVAGGGFEHVVRLPAEGDWWTGLPSDCPGVLAGDRADLRVRHGVLGGAEAWLLTNEGEGTLEVSVSVSGAVWDPWTGLVHAGCDRWTLPRRASAWVTSAAPGGELAPPPAPDAEGEQVPLGPWAASPPVPAGDWTRDRAWETFAGTVDYATTFDLPAAASLRLDLGGVGDVAEVALNGRVVAHLPWAPYRCAIPATATRTGANDLVVRVSNSSANHWEGAMLPSGLLGPVRLSRT